MKRQALVVGINRYPFLKDDKGQTRHLTSAVRDGEAIARRLELDGAFEVRRFPPGDEVWQFDPMATLKADDLEKAIFDLFNPTGSTIADTALLYFAGIGLKRIEDGKSFLATSDSNPRRDRLGVSLQWLGELLKKSPVPEQIVWLDCSYSGDLFNYINPDDDPSRQRCFILAASESEQAIAKKTGGGWLTNILLQGFVSGENNVVSSYSLKKVVESQPFSETFQQHPICKVSGQAIIVSFSRNNILANSPGLLYGRQLTKDKQSSKTPQEQLENFQDPLERLWERTEGWFTRGEELIKKHTASKVARYFPDKIGESLSESAEKYRKEIESALGNIAFPNHWWTRESIENFHECLKRLCNSKYKKSIDSLITSCDNMPVGAAYLLALMAHNEIYGNIEPFNNINLGGYSRILDPIFPTQKATTAKETAKALYSVFYEAFDGAASETDSQVREVEILEDGSILKIGLNWNAVKAGQGKSLVEKIASKISGETISIETLANSNRTTQAVLNLWRNMMLNAEGFGSPGLVYMCQHNLYVASKQLGRRAR